ncbi:unnamed protein product, partial [Closterium sp. NIES-64]
ADIDATLQLRRELKDKWGVAVSVNDFVIKAVAMALAHTPHANVHWDGKAGRVVSNSSVDISIAVATDKGLITPILKDADKKSLGAISKEVSRLCPALPALLVPSRLNPFLTDLSRIMSTTATYLVKQLVERARAGKLQPHEFQGGTFRAMKSFPSPTPPPPAATCSHVLFPPMHPPPCASSISNLGMYAVDRFSAIINPPQSGILAVGRADKVLRLPAETSAGHVPFQGPGTRGRGARGGTESYGDRLVVGGGELVAAGAQLHVAGKMEVTLSADARALDGTTAGEARERATTGAFKQPVLCQQVAQGARDVSHGVLQGMPCYAV